MGFATITVRPFAWQGNIYYIGVDEQNLNENYGRKYIYSTGLHQQMVEYLKFPGGPSLLLNLHPSSGLMRHRLRFRL